MGASLVEIDEEKNSSPDVYHQNTEGKASQKSFGLKKRSGKVGMSSMFLVHACITSFNCFTHPLFRYILHYGKGCVAMWGCNEFLAMSTIISTLYRLQVGFRTIL